MIVLEIAGNRPNRRSKDLNPAELAHFEDDVDVLGLEVVGEALRTDHALLLDDVHLLLLRVHHHREGLPRVVVVLEALLRNAHLERVESEVVHHEALAGDGVLQGVATVHGQPHRDVVVDDQEADEGDGSVGAGLAVDDEGGVVGDYCIGIVYDAVEAVSEVVLGEEVDLLVLDCGFVLEEEGGLEGGGLHDGFHAAVVFLLAPLLVLLLLQHFSLSLLQDFKLPPTFLLAHRSGWFA